MITKATLRDLEPTQPPPLVPDHEMLRRIGRGSYGEVWLARNTLGTLRAVKVVFRSNFEDPRPFEREYTGIRKYEPISRSHPGLVDILQVGRNENEGYFYYVMELADDAAAQPAARTAEIVGTAGRPAPGSPEAYVPRTLAEERKRRGRLSARESIVIGLALCGGLGELHRNRLIHRDIKPSNIIFVEGVAKLADIGLVTDAAEPLSYVGTEGFIPPEGPSTPQADVYSLGKVLYEAAMGKDRLDFPEPATELEELPDRDLLVELNSILLHACQPLRTERYASAMAMHANLELLLQGGSVCAKQNSQRRLRWFTITAGALVLLTLAALGLNRVLDWRTRALQGQSSLVRPALAGKIPPRPARLPEGLIDLSAAYTAPLTERWYAGAAENTLAALPQGIQKFAGVPFDVRGLVQLSGREIDNYDSGAYPTRVQNIWIERWIQRVHFLHGAVAEEAPGAVIGTYRVDYNTGRSVDVPIVYGVHVRSLWQPRAASGSATGAVLAWKGQNAVTQPRGLELRLYEYTWQNPWPAEQVVAIEFLSAMANSAPFLVALTAEDARLRPDQKKVSVSIVKMLQDAAPQFPAIPAMNAGDPLQWSTLTLHRHSAEIGGRFYDGFRFFTPAASADLVWTFAPSIEGSWFILPMTGGLKVGFEDWYEVAPRGNTNESRPSVMQFLSGKKLAPEREYFIWFGSDTNVPIALRAALRFVPSGTIDPNNPADLLRALGTPAGAAYQRHFCLGAIH